MKKLLIIIGISSLLFFMIHTYYTIKENLIYYSVYYAQNLDHHPNYDPVMAMVIDNLEDIPTPSNDLFYYSFDGNGSIIRKKDNVFLTGSTDEYSLFNKDHVYTFTDKGEFLDVTLMGTPLPSYDHQEAEKKGKELAYVLLSPVIDIQPSPPKGQNLQWLFNITYGKIFQ